LAYTEFGKLLYGFGAPLSGVANDPADLANFNNGLVNFQEVETLNSADALSGPAGQLGPLFNSTSCGACHSNPSLGGGGLTLMEQRLSTGGPPVRIFAVDHMMFGGPLSQAGIATDAAMASKVAPAVASTKPSPKLIVASSDGAPRKLAFR